MMRSGIGLCALALGGLVGCGQNSYFSVEVTIPSGISSGTLQKIASCEIMTSGAVSDETDFLLSSSVCSPSASYSGLPTDSAGNHVLGTFEYGTSKDSGTVTFKILLEDGSRGTIGSGTKDASIKSGGIQPVTLLVTDTPGLGP
jgi:type 1 fimbria pilin